MFSYVSLEQRVPQDHPLRAVRKLTDTVLGTLSPEFDVLYADSGRPSIAPEVTFCEPCIAGILLQCARSGCWLSRSITFFVSLGSWPGHGRCDVEICQVFLEDREPLLTSDVAQAVLAEVNKRPGAL